MHTTIKAAFISVALAALAPSLALAEEAALSDGALSGKVGYEQLGGDGVIGFSTPLATLHKFQGFADVFLTTPAAGVEDIYGTLGIFWKNAPVGENVKFFATFHDFQSDIDSRDFGHEIDAGLNVAFDKYWSTALKGAVFDGANGFANRNLIWVALEFRY